MILKGNSSDQTLPPDPRNSPTWREFTLQVPERGPYETNATKKQKEYLWELGLRDPQIIDALGKIQASKMIDAAKNKWREIESDDTKRKFGRTLLWVCGILLLVILLLFTIARVQK